MKKYILARLTGALVVSGLFSSIGCAGNADTIEESDEAQGKIDFTGEVDTFQVKNLCQGIIKNLEGAKNGTAISFLFKEDIKTCVVNPGGMGLHGDQIYFTTDLNNLKQGIAANPSLDYAIIVGETSSETTANFMILRPKSVRFGIAAGLVAAWAPATTYGTTAFEGTSYINASGLALSEAAKKFAIRLVSLGANAVKIGAVTAVPIAVYINVLRYEYIQKPLDQEYFALTEQQRQYALEAALPYFEGFNWLHNKVPTLEGFDLLRTHPPAHVTINADKLFTVPQDSLLAPNYKNGRLRPGVKSGKEIITPPGAGPDDKRGFDGLRDVEKALREAGYDVEYPGEVTPKPENHGKKNPDLKVNGKDVEVYTPAGDTALDGVVGKAEEKARLQGGGRVIINLDTGKNSATAGDVENQLEEQRLLDLTKYLKEVWVLKNGGLRRVYPRRK